MNDILLSFFIIIFNFMLKDENFYVVNFFFNSLHWIDLFIIHYTIYEYFNIWNDQIIILRQTQISNRSPFVDNKYLSIMITEAYYRPLIIDPFCVLKIVSSLYHEQNHTSHTGHSHAPQVKLTPPQIQADLQYSTRDSSVSTHTDRLTRCHKRIILYVEKRGRLE